MSDPQNTADLSQKVEKLCTIAENLVDLTKIMGQEIDLCVEAIKTLKAEVLSQALRIYILENSQCK